MRNRRIFDWILENKINFIVMRLGFRIVIYNIELFIYIVVRVRIIYILDSVF